MAPRRVALSVRTGAWELRLTTAADPSAQLASLAALLGKDAAGLSSSPVVEVQSPGRPADLPSRPSVFENTIYSLTVKPVGSCRLERVGHPLLREIEDSLEEDEGVWRGTLRTGNDIGWFPLEIVVRQADGAAARTDRIAWQVWPRKLDYASDLSRLVDAVEKQYPLWIFKFAAQTEHDAGRVAGSNDRFLLLWLAQFKSLWKELERGMRIVASDPHAALQSSPALLHADRLKGKLPRLLEERAALLVSAGSGRRLPASVWRSSADTPENRFVLHVLDRCSVSLERFRDAVDVPGLSPSFREQLNGWIRSVAAFRSEPVFRGVGPFSGMSKESLVLHNRAGYSAVYRSWLELGRRLEFFSRAATTRIGMRSVSELYEIWCFLAVKDIVESLGFVPGERTAPRWRRSGVERQIENGAGASFLFRGADGVRLTLSHEPSFGATGSGALHCPTVPQRPDIVLEADWPACDEAPARKLLWVFDAKYRLAQDNPPPPAVGSVGSEATCLHLVPSDAIDQMHRYRDSILLRSSDGNSRPVVSAFALYPGVFDQTLPAEGNPYWSAIEAVGVGAFPLLPGKSGGLWLRAHLEQALLREGHSRVLRRRSVRIPVSGLAYPDEDVLIVFLGRDRNPEYLERFRIGRAEAYHIYERGGPSGSRLEKLRFLAFIDIPGGDGSLRILRGVYAIDSKEAVMRSSLDPRLTGNSGKARDGGARCLLFRLGRYLQLSSPIPVGRDAGHWFRYASLNRLFSARSFADVWSSPGELP